MFLLRHLSSSQLLRGRLLPCRSCSSRGVSGTGEGKSSFVVPDNGYDYDSDHDAISSYIFRHLDPSSWPGSSAPSLAVSSLSSVLGPGFSLSTVAPRTLSGFLGLMSGDSASLLDEDIFAIAIVVIVAARAIFTYL